MAQSTRFWEANDYTDDNFAEVLNRLLGDGVMHGVTNELSVSAGTGMQIIVATGEAMVRGSWYKNDSNNTVAVTAADPTNGRIDRAVLRRTASTNSLSVAMLDGTPAGSPVAPALTQTAATWEISLAQIVVGAGVSSIVAGNITDERNFAFDYSGGQDISLTNTSGGALTQGQIVIIDVSASKSFTTTATANNSSVLGVVNQASVANSAVGRVRVSGLALVKVTGTAAVGDYLYTSTTAGSALPSANILNGLLGRALTSITGAGYIYAAIGQSSAGVPKNLIAFTTDTSAPAGWAEYTAARGRYIVGVPSGGTVAGTIGSAMTNLQDLTHNHTYTTVISHVHTFSVRYNPQAGGSAAAAGSADAETGTPNTGSTGSASGTTATASTSTIAPSIQLFTVQRS